LKYNNFKICGVEFLLTRGVFNCYYKIMSEITDLRNDPTVSFWGVMDAGIFCGDTILDRYEPLFIKLVEMSNVLVRKGGLEGSDYWPQNFRNI